jgi:hypothetical protein
MLRHLFQFSHISKFDVESRLTVAGYVAAGILTSIFVVAGDHFDHAVDLRQDA